MEDEFILVEISQTAEQLFTQPDGLHLGYHSPTTKGSMQIAAGSEMLDLEYLSRGFSSIKQAHNVLVT